MIVPLHCCITSLIILVVGAILQIREGNANLFNTSILLLGVTSVIHHSRRSSWFIKTDIVQVFDVCMCLVVSALCFQRYGASLITILCAAYVFSVVLSIWSGIIPASSKDEVFRTCTLHSTIHLAFIFMLLYMELR